jgi:formiminotetrahydrofolate cyclodeaminase
MTIAQALQEMMEAWNKIMAAAKIKFPKATDEELYQISKVAMNHALGKK